VIASQNNEGAGHIEGGKAMTANKRLSDLGHNSMGEMSCVALGYICLRLLGAGWTPPAEYFMRRAYIAETILPEEQHYCREGFIRCAMHSHVCVAKRGQSILVQQCKLNAQEVSTQEVSAKCGGLAFPKVGGSRGGAGYNPYESTPPLPH
jgi:hypothetical protein